MKIIIRPSANKDVKKLPKVIKADIEALVLRLIDADDLTSILNAKKIKGSENAYRIRIKSYRVGFFLEGSDTIIISRILHRKDVYRYFP